MYKRKEDEKGLQSWHLKTLQQNKFQVCLFLLNLTFAVMLGGMFV